MHPHLGQIVAYHSAAGRPAMAAMVVNVAQGEVNLTVFQHNGISFPVLGVPFIEGGHVPPDVCHACHVNRSGLAPTHLHISEAA